MRRIVYFNVPDDPWPIVEEMTKSPIQRIRRFLGSLLCITALKRVYVLMTVNKSRIKKAREKRKRKKKKERRGAMQNRNSRNVICVSVYYLIIKLLGVQNNFLSHVLGLFYN